MAAAYARHRPGYAPAALDWALEPVSDRAPLDVLDLGAGTGALTRQLVGRPAIKVTAVEPDALMLAELRRCLPGLDAREGTAEDIPLPDGAVDAVLVGQALHWFDVDRALPEIVRVLRPRGELAGLWNADDGSVEWVAGYHEAASRGHFVPANSQGGDRPDLPLCPGLEPAGRAAFRHRQRLTVDGLIAVLGTHSWALMSEPADRDAAFTRIRTYLAGRPETQGEFDLPIVTRVLRAVRT